MKLVPPEVVEVVVAVVARVTRLPHQAFQMAWLQALVLEAVVAQVAAAVCRAVGALMEVHPSRSS